VPRVDVARAGRRLRSVRSRSPPELEFTLSAVEQPVKPVGACAAGDRNQDRCRRSRCGELHHPQTRRSIELIHRRSVPERNTMSAARPSPTVDCQRPYGAIATTTTLRRKGSGSGRVRAGALRRQLELAAYDVNDGLLMRSARAGASSAPTSVTWSAACRYVVSRVRVPQLPVRVKTAVMRQRDQGCGILVCIVHRRPAPCRHGPRCAPMQSTAPHTTA
jgi:hypothetical protein